MRTLVTGGRGFVGKHLVDYLQKYRSSITELYSTSRSCFDNEQENERYCDLTDPWLVKTLMEEIKPHIVIHCAADSSGKPTENPLVSYYNNIASTANILENLRPKTRLIFLSSIVVYGDTLGRVNELCPMKPTSMYGASKAGCESLIYSYKALKDIHPTILRLPALVGKDLTHGILYHHLKKVYDDNPVFEVIGGEDGGCKKPYLHVYDLCRIIKYIIEYDVQNIFNVAPEDEVSSKEVAKLVMRTTGSYKPIKMLGENSIWKGDNRHLQVYSQKIKKCIQFKYPSSQEAITQAIKDNINDR